MLMHGCKEGQCSACKSFLLDGEVDLDRYSTFALPDFEEAEGWTLLCRAHAYSDLEVELINYDEEMLHGGTPPRTVATLVEAVEALTRDIRLLRLRVEDDEPLDVQAGPVRRHPDPGPRGASTARSRWPTRDPGRARVHDQALPGRALLRPARRRRRSSRATRSRSPGPTASSRCGAARRGGCCSSAAAPAWRRSCRCCARWRRPGSEREATYYYGARSEADLFHLEELGRACRCGFVPALSEDSNGWAGETGLITDVVDRLEGDVAEVDAYLCGPPPMVDAAIALLESQGRSRGPHLLRQVHDHRGSVREERPWPRTAR